MPQMPTRMPAISQKIVLTCVDPWGRTVDIPTTLGYRTDDPYAIALTFHSRSEDVTWNIARTLLYEGLAAPAGEGDVKVFPSIGEDGRATTVLELSSLDGRLVAEAGSREVQRFLTRAAKLVPLGSESDHLDLDSVVDALLDTA